MEKYYKLTDETIEHKGHILYKIECIKDFGIIKTNHKGGWIEKESNLTGFAWVYDNAKVYDNAEISGNIQVSNNFSLNY
ncbi:MAG: hypothetical protein ACRCZR_06560 [Cetobacterium sp.]